jgi:hypothetical protein
MNAIEIADRPTDPHNLDIDLAKEGGVGTTSSIASVVSKIAVAHGNKDSTSTHSFAAQVLPPVGPMIIVGNAGRPAATGVGSRVSTSEPPCAAR